MSHQLNILKEHIKRKQKNKKRKKSPARETEGLKNEKKKIKRKGASCSSKDNRRSKHSGRYLYERV
jgi:hypothetical protein